MEKSINKVLVLKRVLSAALIATAGASFAQTGAPTPMALWSQAHLLCKKSLCLNKSAQPQPFNMANPQAVAHC